MSIKDQIKNTLKGKLSRENLKPNSLKKKILLGVIVILLAAFGLEIFNTDFDIGKIISGSSVSDSKIMRDKAGNVVADGSGKATDEYNCDDFSTQKQAQSFFIKAGISKDTNRLDSDNDGVACESLPNN